MNHGDRPGQVIQNCLVDNAGLQNVGLRRNKSTKSNSRQTDVMLFVISFLIVLLHAKVEPFSFLSLFQRKKIVAQFSHFLY